MNIGIHNHVYKHKQQTHNHNAGSDCVIYSLNRKEERLTRVGSDVSPVHLSSNTLFSG